MSSLSHFSHKLSVKILSYLMKEVAKECPFCRCSQLMGYP